MMLALAFAWTELSSKSALTARNVSERRPILYAMTQSFIAQLRDAVFKDHPFVAHLYERAHIERIVVAALEAWSLNMLDVEISMTPNATRADIIFQGAYAPLGPNVIANWKHPVIQVSKDRCWYEQRAWCPLIAQNVLTVNIMGSMLCAFLSLPALRFYVHKTGTRAAYVSSFAASLCALVWFVEIAPCLFCFELQTVIMHEVGHALRGRTQCCCATASLRLQQRRVAPKPHLRLWKASGHVVALQRADGHLLVWRRHRRDPELVAFQLHRHEPLPGGSARRDRRHSALVRRGVRIFGGNSIRVLGKEVPLAPNESSKRGCKHKLCTRFPRSQSR